MTVLGQRIFASINEVEENGESLSKFLRGCRGTGTRTKPVHDSLPGGTGLSIVMCLMIATTTAAPTATATAATTTTTAGTTATTAISPLNSRSVLREALLVDGGPVEFES